MIICDCGKIIKGGTFRDYLKTSAGPSTSTIGHKKCGFIFNFIDDKKPKKFSSRKELKNIAMNFCEKNNLEFKDIERFLIDVNRLKSNGNLPDGDILIKAFEKLNNK